MLSFVISKMKFFELIPLKKRVLSLEEKDSQWPSNQYETVVIQFADSETELTAQRFENDDEVLWGVLKLSVNPSLTIREVFHRHSKIVIWEQWKYITKIDIRTQRSNRSKSSHQQYSTFFSICLLNRKSWSWTFTNVSARTWFSELISVQWFCLLTTT